MACHICSLAGPTITNMQENRQADSNRYVPGVNPSAACTRTHHGAKSSILKRSVASLQPNPELLSSSRKSLLGVNGLMAGSGKCCEACRPEFSVYSEGCLHAHATDRQPSSLLLALMHAHLESTCTLQCSAGLCCAVVHVQRCSVLCWALVCNAMLCCAVLCCLALGVLQSVVH